ncbi:MAG: hypothetical protein ACI4WT_00990 [Oligosphaeraceae bacterium]
MEQVIGFLQNSYLYCAVAGTAVFAVLFVMQLMGGDADGADGVDGADNVLEGMNIFSIRSVMAFLATYGWAGLCFRHQGWSGVAIALGCGVFMMLVISFLTSFLMRMQSSGNLSADDFVGCGARVYLSIPGGRAAGGRVIVTLKGCTREVAACADEPIAQGAEVTIVAALSANVYLVRPLA